MLKLIGDKIKDLRKLNGMSQAQLSLKLGVSRSLISHWESNNRKPSYADLEQLSIIFDVTADYLIGTTTVPDGVVNIKKTHDTTRLVEVPLYSHISCGEGCFVDDNIEDYIQITNQMLNSHKEYFCQYAHGDSMIGENINDGDLLVFEITQSINNGQVGSFCVDHGDAVCKKFYHDKENNIIMLHSANDNYDPIMITSAYENFKVVGRLVLVINKR